MPDHLQASEIALFVGVGMFVMIALGLAMVLFAVRAQKRFFEQRLKSHARELDHQRELVQKNLLIQEEERRRIAAHLHDDVGSKLGVLNLSFFRLNQLKPEQEAYGLMLKEIEALIANTLDRTRSISHELLPPAIEDFGLGEAIKELCEQINKTGALEIRFDSELERSEIPDPDAELNLFRIVQELSNNTLKYAQASRIDVSLSKQAEKRRFVYRDNGRGFDPAVLQGKGLGLKNLENRVKLLGGSLEINTAPGKGFEAKIDF
jgi:signal transduction histidine kinase